MHTIVEITHVEFLRPNAYDITARECSMLVRYSATFDDGEVLNTTNVIRYDLASPPSPTQVLGHVRDRVIAIMRTKHYQLSVNHYRTTTRVSYP